MSSALRNPPSSIAALAADALARLRSVGAVRGAVPLHLARAVRDSFELRAERWAVGAVGAVAEARVATVTGRSSEILNVLIFPARPAVVPLFVAELLVTGGQPRLAFLDLQDGGLTAARRREVAERCTTLTREAAATVGPPAAPPDWAVALSCGGYCFTRGPVAGTDDLCRVFGAYLDLWVELASAAADEPTGPSAAVADFKAAHLAHWPGTAYLEKLFGPDWTREFLHHFLYQ